MSTGFISNGEDLANIFPRYQRIVTGVPPNQHGDIYTTVYIDNPFPNTNYFVSCSIEHLDTGGDGGDQAYWYTVSSGCGAPVIVNKGLESFIVAFTGYFPDPDNSNLTDFWRSRLVVTVIYSVN
jgi:hypothetical protein